MKLNRKALIIYCNNTSSGSLPGPAADNNNLINYLTSNLGGCWDFSEIISLPNPSISTVRNTINNQFTNVEYSLVVFSGHGFIAGPNNTQYIELLDGDISINEIVTKAIRQSIIIDACRNIIHPININESRNMTALQNFLGDIENTRVIFDNAIRQCDQGISVLYSASANESSVDSQLGGAYLYSFIKSAEIWGRNNNTNRILTIRDAHYNCIPYMKRNFVTTQNPVMQSEKRMFYFPFGVK